MDWTAVEFDEVIGGTESSIAERVDSMAALDWTAVGFSES
jgi:hypothetical protein